MDTALQVHCTASPPHMGMGMLNNSELCREAELKCKIQITGSPT